MSVACEVAIIARKRKGKQNSVIQLQVFGPEANLGKNAVDYEKLKKKLQIRIF